MNTKQYFDICFKVSKLITKTYSTSFFLSTSLLEKEKRNAIYAIYGFVRLVDEIVDSFHEFNKEVLLKKLKEELHYALENGISTNPIITSFAFTVKKYKINIEYIQAFFKSMENDLTKTEYNNINDFNSYVFGSADVIGLMCLKVFCDVKNDLFEKLKYHAQKLGSAFQKVNFLRDLKDDMNVLGRTYFPELSGNQFNYQTKKIIEDSIQKDFDEAQEGINLLPGRSKLSVAIAFYYYKSLFKKLKRLSPEKILKKRVRISNLKKYLIILKVFIMYKLKVI